jgi:hypothetical protein
MSRRAVRLITSGCEEIPGEMVMKDDGSSGMHQSMGSRSAESNFPAG